MACTIKENMIEYLVEFDRTFNGPLSHLFESEKASKYKELTVCEFETSLLFNRLLYMVKKLIISKGQATKPAKDW